MFHGLRTNNSCKDKFLEIKTDMSKACDQVEWSFVQKAEDGFFFGLGDVDDAMYLFS